ncbi:hypothetical protein Tco_1053936 [Tanacetum coccineum]|uniref:Uncharacterized protein n=1 Tax=Tanacetum coccineum TaxID=301880 RepID=A0ABQ5GW95_9ASTR
MQYDVAAIYGYISIGAFPKTTLFYIDRHTSEVIARLYGPIMRILSVVRIEVFPMYGYNYMKKIVLRRADLKEYVIAERDFKYLYPIDFEIFYLSESLRSLKSSLTRDKKIITTAVNYGQEKLMIMRFNEIHKFSDGTLHQIDEALDLQDSRNLGSLEVPGLDTRCWTKIDCRQCRVAWSLCLPFRNELMTRRILRFALNLTKPRWEAIGFEFKHDFTIIDSPRAVIFRDRYGVQMIMRFNEIHKFSDGTQQQIDEALDYRVKEFRINRTNPGMHARFWTKKDVDRSKDFMFAIQK